MNADHEFAVLDWNYASEQDTAGHSELKSDFPTSEIDQNEPIDVGPCTSRELTSQELVIPPEISNNSSEQSTGN